MTRFSGGTGFPACADRLAGEDARPTDLFMLYGWANGPWGTVPKSLWWDRYFTGAGAQVENLCHQRL